MKADEMWEKSGLSGYCEYWAFGGDPDKLADLVVRGVKTATCSAYDSYAIEGERIPEAGDYSVICDSRDEAVCIIRTTKVTLCPFDQVSEEHAYKEGEGDRSLDYWREVHREFFTDEMKSNGGEFREDMMLICEEFDLISNDPEEETSQKGQELTASKVRI